MVLTVSTPVEFGGRTEGRSTRSTERMAFDLLSLVVSFY